MLRVLETELFVLPMHTRMPFRYGIATLTELPHLFVRLTADIDGRPAVGIAADGLAPKWFTKSAETPVQDEIDDMLAVVRAACEHACRVPPAKNVFDLWWEVYQAQRAWAAPLAHPPLLWGLGVSLVERALIDAVCRSSATPFAKAVRNELLGVDLERVHDRLRNHRVAEFLPERPLDVVVARHTIGLADPITDAEIPASERLHDGLPQSLQACIRHYGLTHFKIKLPADPDEAVDRLRAIRGAVQSVTPGCRFTLDGNEFFRAVAPFRALWDRLTADRELGPFLREGLLFVEQPLHRDAALGAEAARDLRAWTDRPPLIIDESDGELESLPQALAAGYAGTSYKNCKGVFKGIANACLIGQRQAAGEGRALLSGEDLANVGPVALLQDLAAVATLGIPHVERNGHHYFAGLSALPAELQQQMVAQHGDLYAWHESGAMRFAAVQIRGGRMDLSSVNAAPFGCRPQLDLERIASRLEA